MSKVWLTDFGGAMLQRSGKPILWIKGSALKTAAPM
jgi:hypothetical protein